MSVPSSKMSELQTFLLAVDHNKQEAIQIAEQTARKLEAKQTNLIDVVQSLSEYINDEDGIIRGKAVSYLTAVIKALPPKFLSRQQIQVLASFYCDRIEDGGAIAGLDKLQSLERFNKEVAKVTLRAIFVHFQELRIRPQSQRFQILQLLNELMLNHREAMRDMGDESLVGIVDLVSGERDPRNLMLIFSILKVLMVEWDISNHVQILFDSVYNYFPITFKPPPNDPYGITAQDLKERLQECISSTDLFGPHAFPLLLDKLDSTSANVKKDVLNALAACISTYAPVAVSRYSTAVWDSLKFEILNAQEEVLAEEALRVLQILAKRLSGTGSTHQRSPLEQYFKPITKECNEQLREPQQKQAKPARQILRSLSAASSDSFTLIVRAVVAPLLTVYQDASVIAKQRALLDTLVALFESALFIYGTWTSRGSDPGPENPLTLFQGQLIEILSQALMGPGKEEVSFRVSALKGLLLLSILRNFLEDSEIGLFVQYLDEILLCEESGRDDLRKEAVLALAEISKYKPQMIMDTTLPAFVATLPDFDVEGDVKYLTTLESLAQISIEKNIFETLIRRLLSKLDDVLQRGNPSSPAYPRAILQTILYAMNRKGLDNDPNLDFYYNNVVVKLCRQAALAAMETCDKSLLNDTSVLDSLGRLCSLIVRSLAQPKQDEVFENLYGLFATQDGFTPVPFSGTTCKRHRETMVLSTYLLAGLPKNSTKLPYISSDMFPLIREIVRLSISEEDVIANLALVRHIALLVNKFLPAPGLPIASEILTSLLPSPIKDQQLSLQSIRTIFWLSKALILRLAPATTQTLAWLLELLSSSDPVTSSTSAHGFTLLLGTDDVLSATNGANIRLLARQRVLTSVVPLIASSVCRINSASGGATVSSPPPSHAKKAYLTALSGILSTIPSSLVMTELPTLLPLLLQSLDLNDPDFQSVKVATLETLAVIIRDNGIYVINDTGHVSDLVTRLLTAATHSPSPSIHLSSPPPPPIVATSEENGPQSGNPRSPSTATNSPRVRSLALQCLLLLAQKYPSSLTSYRESAEKGTKRSPLLPLKNAVLRSLKVILDDPKREVRKAAVDARAAWLWGVGSEQGDDDDD